MRRFSFLVLVCGVVFGAAANEFPPAVLAEAASVAVQDGGRIKPLDTYARFSLLQLSGRSKLRVADGGSMSALDWLLECLLDEARARERAVFLIENPEVMDALGLSRDIPRTRFSHAQIRPVRAVLFSLARKIGGLPETQRSVAQGQILRLADNVRLYESLLVSIAPLRQAASSGGPALSTLLRDDGGASKTFALAPVVQSYLSGDSDGPLNVIPPNRASGDSESWRTPGGLVRSVVAGNMPAPQQLDALRALEAIAAAAPDDPDLPRHIAALRAAASETMRGDRQYRQIPREVRFYRVQPFFWSMLLYLLAFLAVCVAGLFPRNPAPHAAGITLLAAAGGLHLWGIAMRCIIRGRPPVSTLYETILFVSIVAVAVAFIAELLTRRRVAAGAGAGLGALGLFLAGKYEIFERADTMPSLAAVLDSNFWLASHVTIITVGYAAGLLASAVAHVYLIGKFTGYRPRDPNFYAHLTRLVYGIFCFGLLFATVGTLLGGIWANESWGRFWGWDPKENGALMIVLWGLAVLHARLGGYIRDDGLHLAAVFGGTIVLFSWFGVNLLGVGLHTYGFTSGIQMALRGAYAVESLVLTLAALAWLRTRMSAGPPDR